MDELENKLEPIEEYKIGQKIGEILNVKEHKVTDTQELAEYCAFQFLANYPNKDTGWGTYYGPMFVLPNKENQMVEFPSIRAVNDEMLVYWRKRAEESKHPTLSARYADLVVDFAPKIKNTTIDFTMAQKVIDASIEICAKNLDDALGCKDKLQRALALAKQINDTDRLEKLITTIIETESKFEEDDKPGLWGYAFKWLVLENNRVGSLTEQQQNTLLAGLENRLNRLSNPEEPNTWNVECAVVLLAEHYAKSKDEKKLNEALSKLEKAFRDSKQANSDGLLILNYLEKLLDIYSRYAQFEFAKQAAARVRAEISNIGERGKFAMHEVSAEINISNEEIKQFLDSIFGSERGAEPINKVIPKLVVSFILKKDHVDKQLKDISSKYVFKYLVTNTVISEFNYPAAQVGPINEDYDRHLLQHFSQNLHFQSPFLKWSFDELTKYYTPEALYDELTHSPVFRVEDKDYILKTFGLFWKDDFLPFNHLAIPLIEDAIRRLCKMSGISTIKPNDDGGYDERSLYELVKSGVIKRVFSTKGEDVEYYFHVLLTCRIGWNLRNNFAHGINKNSLAEENVANRLMHIILCLSQIRKNDKQEESND
ncbi:MAG: hypothetical protein UV61_C0020G0010 [Candidatus Gottesmanbacteria bacterium GW2011_GWB1_43_11]|uniref:DUF4209 domain-containing protein n=1 Tax=Candidatus Gottesmanbacteria bacterium GW2011_GWB1_43_11 TaxID=1618446 RepID=A0A0G1CI57_9BACT|nr:MAG: hypothetical protein UV61_C0020G0010 [Candidatus Gottesmanbacteria bacterium GW2011_GWB1_43_11]KKT96397.1 MAG: hypothetical protein UW97_C0013G0010 [Parcubacteria group bacterium GW2011_GWA2_45_15]